MRVVKAFAREERQRERFREPVRRVFDQSMVVHAAAAPSTTPFIGFLPQLGLAAILFVGGRQVIHGTLTLGDFVAFYGYLLMLLGPMRMLGIALGMAQRAAASGARLFEMLDRAPRARRAAGRAAAARGRGPRGAARRDASPTTAPASRRCATSTLDVEPGRTVALVGATGSGKTTLVQLLPRLYDADAGRGADRRRRRARRRPRRRCAARSRSSTDDPFLFSATLAREHRLRARRTRRARRSSAPRARAQAHEFIDDAARRLRHPRRRARPDALAAASASARDRPRAAGRPAHPDPRRRHLVGRRHDRARDQGGAARGHGGAHDVRHRPPPLHDRAGRRDRRARGRRGRRARHARGAARDSPLYREIAEKGLPDQVFLTRKPLEREVAGL